MKILMVSAEAAPFAKTGGLADAVSALSKALAEAGHDVKIIIPRYYFIDRKNLILEKKSVLVNIGFSDIIVNFYCADYKNLHIYFVDYEKLFGRSGIYGENAQSAYADNPLRFNVLARAAFALCRELGWIPDIIQGIPRSAPCRKNAPPASATKCNRISRCRPKLCRLCDFGI